MHFQLQKKDSDKDLFSSYRYYYIGLFNKKGKLHLAENFFRSICLKFKLNVFYNNNNSSIIKLRDSLTYTFQTIAPIFYLRKVTLGGLEYKVPWVLSYNKQVLHGCLFVLKVVKRKGSSKKDKIAKVLSEALNEQGDAIIRRNEIYKLGSENRGLIYFLK